ncbi:unnamed protein product [Brassicogethes aeneus]|uniref:Anaphase-promoting complex subunit 5 n=1 Tax=Brassicogethes aeneus TaxID=1431903 RepID=A0A9P0AQ83_BRAAE|nr:unnamed protein product [Brassicogethes aeneus]
MSSKDSQFVKKPYTGIVTPHRLTVAILINIFCSYRDSESFKSLKNSIAQCSFRRNFACLCLQLMQRPDLTLKDLRDLLQSDKYRVPIEVLDAFDETLEAMYHNGSGYMLDNVDSFSRCIQVQSDTDSKLCPRTFVAKNSVVGYYVRRLIVYFDNLTFSEITGVYLAFQRYYERWKNLSKENVSRKDLITDRNRFQEQWSRRQAELFIATQAELLSNNVEKAMNPVDMQKTIASLLKSNPRLSEAHFLSYLNYARIKDFCGAINSLYHCFDKGLVLDKGSSEERSKGQRYAALNLAILHHHFNHNDEALASLNESIKLSHEANDNVCLQEALSWLYRISKSNKDKLISHCTLKSFELNLTYTKSLGLQCFGKFSVENSGNPQPIFEILAKSDLINYQHNHRDLICNNYTMKAALWQFYGKTEMGSLWSQLFMYLNLDSWSPSNAFYGEGFCLSMCNIANNLLQQGDYNLVHVLLSFLRRRYPNEPRCLAWKLIENLFVYTKAFHNEKWYDAECAAQKIMVLNKYEGYLRLGELYYYKEDYAEAHRCATDLLKLFDEEKDMFFYTRAKVLLAEIQFASSFPNIPPGIITILEDILMDATKYRLDFQTAIIYLHIAHVQFLMGLTSQALKVLDKALVQIMAHGGNFDRARAMLLYAKLLIAGSKNLDESPRVAVLNDAADILEKVKNDFDKVQAYSRVKDVLYLQSQLYNIVKRKEERNKCSYEFRKLGEVHNTKNHFTLVKYL